MIEIDDGRVDDAATRANETTVKTQANCEDRGEGLKPRHVYLAGSEECACGRGPKLSAKGERYDR